MHRITFLQLGPAVLTEHTVYEIRHYSVRPETSRVSHSVLLYRIQDDVTFELATLLPPNLHVRVICNKIYGN